MSLKARTDLSPKSVCFVVSSPLTLKFFFVDQIAALSEIYDFACVANCDDQAWLQERGIVVPLFKVRIERGPSLRHDLSALWVLYRFFRSRRFDVVHSNTPKAGLLAMSAAALAKIPVRIHTFTGQPWANRTGVWRSVLKLCDKLTAALATHILIDSESQRLFLMREGVVKGSNSTVLGHGSVSGVDIARFSPNYRLSAEIRKKYDVSDACVVFIYLGRLKRDKGILDLVNAFSQLANLDESVRLFIVGPDEDHLESEIREACSACTSRVTISGYTDEPESWLAASDVLCLPSYCEGFGSTIIEAAAVGIPALGSRIYGITDAIEEGVTGFLHEPRDVNDIVGKMRIFAADPELRGKFGNAARDRAIRYFAKEKLTAAVVGFYKRTLDVTPS